MSAARTARHSVDEAIRRRRSVRGFLPDEVPEATLREVFELAQWAPSNCNVQPWTPHVVSGRSFANDCATRWSTRACATSPSTRIGRRTASFSAFIASGRSTRRQQLYGAMGVERRDLVGRKMAYIRNHACLRRAACRLHLHAGAVRRPRGDRHRHVCADADACADGARHRLLRAGRAESLPRHRARTSRRARKPETAVRRLVRIRGPAASRPMPRASGAPMLDRCRPLPSLSGRPANRRRPKRAGWRRRAGPDGPRDRPGLRRLRLDGRCCLGATADAARAGRAAVPRTR